MDGAVTSGLASPYASPAKAGARYRRNVWESIALSNRKRGNWAPAFAGEAC